jgi:hypothetical protein
MRRKTRHAHLWLRCLRRHGPETASTPPLGLDHHPVLNSPEQSHPQRCSHG